MEDSAANTFLLTRPLWCDRDDAHEARGDRIVSDLLLLDPAPLPEGLGIPAADWHQTPTSVRHQFLALLKRVDALESRLHQDSSNSSRSPSTDSPSAKRQR